MLILNKTDMRQAVGVAAVMDKVEDAYRVFASGKFNMPERPVVTNGDNTILYMPCFMDSFFGTKYLTLFPGNPQRGLPFIQGLMLLGDADDGKTLAILDGSFITSLRTGAVGGVGIRCFSPDDASSVGIIGAGTQGFYQALFACAARPISDIYLYDTADKDWLSYTKDLLACLADSGVRGQDTGDSSCELREADASGSMPDIHICDRVEELVRCSDIVITATPATSPVIPDDPDLMRGKCFIAIGSFKPGMRELPDAVWQLVDHVYTELPFAMEESGDLSQPLSDGLISEEQVRFIGDLLTATPRPIPPPRGATTYFKSVGMGLLDLNVAQLIYENALDMGIGTTVSLL